MVKFVRWSCGCTGIIIDNDSGGDYWIIECCEDGSGVCLGRSRRQYFDDGAKPYELLSGEHVASLLAVLGELVADGYKFRQLKQIMNGR